MQDTYSQAYAEILEIIGKMEPDYKNKIPKELIDFFEKNKDKNYKFNIKENMIFSQKTIDLLAMLELKYLANETEKEELKKALNENEIKHQEELRKKYNPDNLFKNKVHKIETSKEPITIVDYKESIFTKIKKWFKRDIKKIIRSRLKPAFCSVM